MRQVLSEWYTSDFDVDQMGMTESMVGFNYILDEPVWNDDAIGELVVGPRRNLEVMVEEAGLADSLFVGGQRKLMQ